MDKLVFLGSASNSLGQLNTSSFALKLVEGGWILVDCGPDTPRQIGRAGIPLTDITYIIITHRHLDHCLGLPYFLTGRQLESAAKAREIQGFSPTKLNIIAEEDVWDKLYGLFKLCHPEVKLPFDIQHIDINSFLSLPCELAGINLQTFTMNHAVPTYGFVIQESGRKLIAYSSDTLPSDPFISAAQRVKILIHEAMVPGSETAFSDSTKHSTTLQAGNVISKVQPEQVFLMHIRPVFWSKRSLLEQEASTAGGISAAYPDDGLSISLT